MGLIKLHLHQLLQQSVEISPESITIYYVKKEELLIIPIWSIEQQEENEWKLEKKNWSNIDTETKVEDDFIHIQRIRVIEPLSHRTIMCVLVFSVHCVDCSSIDYYVS